MKETQDNHWIDKIKELLENYTPADPPGDWKQVQRDLNRTLPWAVRLLICLRNPWVYGILLGAALITGAICLYPDVAPRANEDQEIIALKHLPVAPVFKPGLTNWNNSFHLSRPLKAWTSDDYDPCPTPGLKTGATSKGSYSRGPISQNLILSPPAPHTPPSALVIPAGIASPDTKLTSGPNLQPATDILQPATGSRQPATKKRLPLPSVRLPGDPWKLGLGYEYLPLILPDTGRGSYRGFNIRFTREVSKRLWLGTGLTIGRIDLIEVSKNWVRDWSKTDSLGTIFLRDSTTSEHRWQKHAAIPLTITWDLFRNRNFAIPVTAGSTLGWVYHRRHLDVYEDFSSGGGGPPSEFTYFITADLSLGYEVFYLYGLSATLSAEYHRILTGRRSYGFGQNFIGARILINLDFDEKKW